jgi:Tol biopolymer transport system component
VSRRLLGLTLLAAATLAGSGSAAPSVATAPVPAPIPLAWRPGGEIAFAAVGGGIYVTSVGHAPRLLSTRSPGDLAWSPDGRTLLTSSNEHVVAIDAASGRTTTLAAGFGPAWSPDGRRIAFNSLGAYYVMNADGSGRRKVARARDVDAITVAWSPNGKRLAYVRCTAAPGSQPCEHQYGLDVYSVRATGGDERRITRKSGFPQCLAWSTSGLAYAFDDHIEIARASGARTVVPGLCPVWAPDGHRLATSGRPVTIVDVRTRRRRRVAIPNADPSYEFYVAWAPDGSAIAALGPDLKGRTRIWVVRLRDGHVTVVA